VGRVTKLLPFFLYGIAAAEWARLTGKVIIADERLARRGMNNRPVGENAF